MNDSTQNHHRPYWKRIHHTWYFWVFMFLTFASIMYYIISVDFAFAPHKPMMPSSQNHRAQ